MVYSASMSDAVSSMNTVLWCCVWSRPQAGSESELYPQGDSLGSSGSASTLASSVIEVEAERDDLELGLEEDMTPPTLSITEEILQFINQSRAREGLPDLQPDTVSKRFLASFLVKKFLLIFIYT